MIICYETRNYYLDWKDTLKYLHLVRLEFPKQVPRKSSKSNTNIFGALILYCILADKQDSVVYVSKERNIFCFLRR